MNRTDLGAATLFITLFAPLAHSEADVFSGVYRFRTPDQPGSYVVEPVGVGKWRIGSRASDGQPVEPFPIPGMPSMVVAAPETVDSWFDQASPREKMACLAWPGSHQNVFSICRIPVDATYRVMESMSSGRDKSETGYIFVAGTPAGVLAGDLIRAPARTAPR